MPIFEPNNLVKCTDTDRVGIIIKTRRGIVATMVLVQWNGTTKANWVDAATLELVG
jgi:hypothetical protein